MQCTLNIDGFIQYMDSTGRYTEEQLAMAEQALYTLEGDMARLSWKEHGLYSHEYIAGNLTQCGKKLSVYMMTEGMKQAKAAAAVKDFKQ